MAGAITHLEFCKDINEKTGIPMEIKNFSLYGQGHDALICQFFLRYYRDLRISLTMSHEHFQEMISNLIIVAKKEKFENNMEFKKFLYGYLSHQILDSFIHPYILQIDPNYMLKKGEKWIHGVIETALDCYIVNNSYNGSFDILNELKYHNNPSEKQLFNIIDHAGYNTYNEKNIGQRYKHGYENFYFWLKTYRSNIIINYISKNLDRFFKLGASDFSYVLKNADNLLPYANLSHQEKIFNYCGNPPLTSTNSIFDCYNEALDLAISTIKSLENLLKYINEYSLEDIINVNKEIVPNRSGISGFECGSNHDVQYKLKLF